MTHSDYAKLSRFASAAMVITALAHSTLGAAAPAPGKWEICAAIIGSSIYVISGGPKPGATFSSVNEVFTPIQ